MNHKSNQIILKSRFKSIDLNLYLNLNLYFITIYYIMIPYWFEVQSSKVQSSKIQKLELAT